MLSKPLRSLAQYRVNVLFVLLLPVLPAMLAAQSANVDAIANEWNSTILPVIKDACLDCHSGNDAEGSLDLAPFQSIDDVVAQRRQWRKIGTRVRDHQMPPEDTIELSDDDRERFLAWLDQSLPQVPCSHQHHAGAVTIRRLTRYEYANTVRELLNVDYPFSDTFPADEVGYGFDNIGDVLSVSPLLLEKYLTAAEAISELVVLDPAKNKFSETLESMRFGEVPGGHVRGSHMMLTTKGTITVEIKTQLAGRYQIEVDAFGNQAGKDLPQMAVSANGKMIETVNVRPTSAEDAETFKFSARMAKGRNKIQVTFTNDFYNPGHKNPRKRDRNLGVCQIKVHGPTSVPRPSRAQQAFLFRSPASGQSPRVCAAEIINLHVSRAFRRRVYKSERERLLQLFDLGIENGESFEGAMQLVIQAMLVSPHFLYKVEAPAPADGSPRQLADYEVATALSYFLWSSMPDDQLFKLATEQKLQEEGRLESEVHRMLQDEKSMALIDNFASQWLQLPGLEQSDPDPELFPGFTDHLRNSMIQETRLLLGDVIRKDAALTTMLTADYTYVNKTLARHYGWSTQGLKEREFSKVSLQGKQRRGLLSHASFLTLTSNPTRTSPVKRGKWVLENLLADPPPPASPDVPQLDSQEDLKGSLRERMVQHREDPNCAHCHYKMDSLGFALENFDAFGRYRVKDQDGCEIDSLGQLPNGMQFDSAAELQELIAREQRQQFIRCVVEKLFVYAVGRGPVESDECLIEGIAGQAFENDHRCSDIVLAIIRSEAFLSRSRPNLNR